MRGLARLGSFAVAIASAASAASAADFGAQIAGGHYAFAYRAEPVTIYDYEPGIYMRAYWTPSWGDRRYFPMTGKRPRVGRDENLRQVGHYKPAESFYREWSTTRFFRETLPPPLPAVTK
ncbi:MAG: hypothetical protein JO237_10655 [Pseudolabrys sp.]|nr:hypothetical protein [Pseudolabrys sp.]